MGPTYKLDRIIRKISAPVILNFPDKSRLLYQNGEKAANSDFEKKYLIDEIFTDNGRVEIRLKEAEEVNINWIGEEAVAFF